jgi:hypothetical protein
MACIFMFGVNTCGGQSMMLIECTNIQDYFHVVQWEDTACGICAERLVCKTELV